MNSFLRNLTASQQIGALFIVVFGVLSLATLWGFFRSLREHASDDPQAEAHAQEVKRFWGLIKTSWVMATVCTRSAPRRPITNPSLFTME